MEWINVKDQLPDSKDWTDSKECLVVMNGYVYLGSFVRLSDVKSNFSIAHIHSFDPLPITHWMPLPEPPTVNGQANG